MKMQKLPVYDLHCDLLSFLARDPAHSPYDPAVRCSIPQLIEGNVKLQTLAIFSNEAPDSYKNGEQQIATMKRLLAEHKDKVDHLKTKSQLDNLPTSQKVAFIPAIENLSALCGCEEPLSQAFHRITTHQHSIGKFLYASLTWNHENRFGGGASTDIGLKQDGKEAIEYLAHHHIAIDLSHTSDRLAEDILNHVDKKNLKASIIASHSNMRSITAHPRNLPDIIAKEIIRRKGVIGLNFINMFIGDNGFDLLAKHLEHLLQLGGAEHVCFGADFFHDMDLPPQFRRPGGSFFKGYDSAAAYPAVLQLLRQRLALEESILEGLAWMNLSNYLSQNLFAYDPFQPTHF